MWCGWLSLGLGRGVCVRDRVGVTVGVGVGAIEPRHAFHLLHSHSQCKSSISRELMWNDFDHSTWIALQMVELAYGWNTGHDALAP